MNGELRASLDKLYATVTDFVRMSGGDGDGWIVSEYYQALANDFDHWRKGKGWRGADAFPSRSDGIGYVSFMDEPEESIVFVNDRTLLPNWAGDIIVESSHFEFVARYPDQP